MGVEENKEVVRLIVVEEYIPGYPEYCYRNSDASIYG
jgi:hypothetical protein